MDGHPYFLDYRETAPAAAFPNMYLDGKGEPIPGLSLSGNLAAGIPGTVRGFAEAQRRFGRLSWKRDLEPAIALARDGFVVPAALIYWRNTYLPAFAKSTNFATWANDMQVGKRFRQPVLAVPQTTHFSIVDRSGNAVSNTYTLNGGFGSGVVVEGAGFVLNDEMDDFSIKPGSPNQFGVVGGDANAVGPGKRPLSSMTPTILVKHGQPAMVIGTPGGSRIFTSVFQVLVDVYDFNMPLAAAVAAPRYHHQLLPAQTIFWEPFASVPADLSTALKERGYTLESQEFNGDIAAIEIQGRSPVVAADPRGRGVGLIIQ